MPIPEWKDAVAEAEMTTLKSLFDVVRRFRTEYNVEVTRKIQVAVKTENSDKARLLGSHRELVMSLGGVSDLVLSGDGPVPPSALTEIVDEVEITIALAHIVNRDAKISCLSRDVGRVKKELEGSQRSFRIRISPPRLPQMLFKQFRKVTTSFRKRRRESTRTSERFANRPKGLVEAHRPPPTDIGGTPV